MTSQTNASAADGALLPALLCDLPMFRPVALKMLKVLSREDSHFGDVSRILESDPGFAAEVLTAANSSLYAVRSPVSTLLRAIVVLGAERVKTLTLTVAMRAFLRLPRTEELRRTWRHSRACALLAEELAEAYGVAEDFAYTAGLMHDVGRFGLLAGSAESYGMLLASPFDSPLEVLEAERARFGFDHSQAGQLLVRTWRLAPELARVAGGHHAAAPGGTEGVLALIGMACPLAAAFGFPAVLYGRQQSAGELTAVLPGRRRTVAELHTRLEEKFHSLDLE